MTTSSFRHINFLKKITIFASVFYFLIITGCNNQETSTVHSNNAANNPNVVIPYVINGRVVKGPVDLATVKIFSLDSLGNKKSILASTNTNPNGEYQISLHASPNTSLAIEASGGTYIDEATGARTAISKNEFLESYIVLPLFKTLNVNITPITTIASALSRYHLRTQNLSLQNAIEQAQIKTAVQFGVKDILTTNIPHFSEINKSSQDEQNYFLALAGFTQLDKNEPDLSALQIIQKLVSGIESNGIWANYQGIKPDMLSNAVKQFLASHPGTLTANLDDAIKIFGSPSESVLQGHLYTFTPTVHDFDFGVGFSENFEFSISNKPQWAAFDTVTGTLSGIPSGDDVGKVENIIINVKDNTSEEAILPAFTIEIIDINDPPVFQSKPALRAKEDLKYQYQVTTSDLDARDEITFLLEKAPNGMLISKRGLISWIPTNNDVGSHEIVVSAQDNGIPAASTRQVFTLVVENVNDNPSITSTAPVNKIAQDIEFLYQPIVYDPDLSDTIHFALDFAPQGMNIDATNGKISWTPSAQVSGQFDVRLRVTDRAGTTGIQDFSLFVVIPQFEWKLKFVDSEETAALSGHGYLAFDGNSNTFWQSRPSRLTSPPHEIQIDLGIPYNIDGMLYQPRTDTFDGMISHYQLYLSDDGVNWGTSAITGRFEKSPTEQYAKIDAPDKTKTGRYIRLIALKAYNDKPYVSAAEINLIGLPTQNYRPKATISFPIPHITTVNIGDKVSFAANATDPENNQPFSYSWTFGDTSIPKSTRRNPGLVQFNNPGTYTVNLSVTDSASQESPLTTRIIRVLSPNEILIPRTDWQIIYADSEESSAENGLKENILDNNGKTIWHTEWFYDTPDHPHEIKIDLGQNYTVEALLYLPRQDGSNGRLADFEIYISSDSINWGPPIAQGTLSDSQEEIKIPLNNSGRYIRLVSRNEVNGSNWAAIAEINIIGR